MILLSKVKKAAPWWLRIGAKLLLSRLPIPYRIWKCLKLFEHGDMNVPARAVEVFMTHAQTGSVFDELCTGALTSGARDYAVMELGPGDSLATMVIASSLGATTTWLVDSGSYASKNLKFYGALINYLSEAGVARRSLAIPKSMQELLENCNGRYLTEGVGAISQIPTGSIDFMFSNAVMEHIVRADVIKFVEESARILKPSGVAVHRIDLKDHLGGGLNNLRFSDRVWEGDLFRNAGFYTNRIRFSEFKRIFEEAGFDMEVPRIDSWESVPISRHNLNSEFRKFSNEELSVSGFDVVLRHHP